MDNLIVVKNVNKFIRKEEEMSVSPKIYPTLNNKVRQIINDAKQRAIMDGRKTIMAKDL